MKNKTYVIKGSDKRMHYLSYMLCERGMAVSATDEYLPERAEVVYVFAPGASLGREQAMSLRDNSVVYVGRLKNEALLDVERKNIVVVEMNEDKKFLVENAKCTAEAAVAEIMQRTERTLRSVKVLIVGFGRIGRALTKYLTALEGDVTVLSTRPQEAAIYAKSVGYAEVNLGDYDVIVSTTPAHVFGKEQLAGIKDDAYVLELASPPYCCDVVLAEKTGVKVVVASSLPAKSKAKSAAELIVELIDREENK